MKNTHTVQCSVYTCMLYMHNMGKVKVQTILRSPVVVLKDIADVKSVKELERFGKFKKHDFSLCFSNVLELRCVFTKQVQHAVNTTAEALTEPHSIDLIQVQKGFAKTFFKRNGKL